ncbi:MAG: serine/threonine protein kinase [Polyangiaceae bacterium]|nr:serine/threonine protein kinase [Polyangiaceae bacterium]
MAKPFKLLDASQGRPRLDRYELIAELAAGGMATIYLARIGGAGGFQRFVAIKQLHPHLAHEVDFVEMFLDEARLAASIHHPNVVPILEVGESPSGYYLVMEYIEGDTLWNLRNVATDTRPGGKLPVAVAIRIVHDALLGLHAAHELTDETGKPLNVVHRDVSPQNILVGVDGTARITDFGVARAATRLSSTRSGEVKGKMAYMAPEQIRGQEIDRRADVFAMGVVLWEVLANRHLFLGPSEVATMHRVLHEPVPDLLTLAPNIPKGLAELVARALDRDPSRRFATALEMAEAIEAATRGVMPLPQPREVAAVVDSLVGQRIADRKEAITRWLAGSQGQVGSTGTWTSLPPAVAAQILTPTSSRLPLPAQPPGPPPPRPLPPPVPVRSLSTGSSLSPLLTAPASALPPPALPSTDLSAPASAQPHRRLFLLVPGLLLVGLGLGWALTHTNPAAPASAPAAVSPPPPSATMAPEASASPPAPSPQPTTSEIPAPPVAPSSTPFGTMPAKSKGKNKPPPPVALPTSTGLDSSPYR